MFDTIFAALIIKSYLFAIYFNQKRFMNIHRIYLLYIFFHVFKEIYFKSSCLGKNNAFFTCKNIFSKLIAYFSENT